MTRYSQNIDPNRLHQLSSEVSRIASTLAQLSMGTENQTPAPRTELHDGAPGVAEDAVRWIIGARNLRFRFLPAELFADPAWDILLELLRAEIAQQRICVSSLCIAANAPATTALRYIKTMATQGLIVREPDAFDGRRVYIALAPEMSKALRAYVASVFEKPVAMNARIAA
jgi:DNA-binding MarR family transcriptional regulator